MTSRAPDPGRRNPRSRAAILAATRELLAEAGFRALTIEKIAARAGVGKQTIYRWWPSKGAVVFDALLALSETPEGAESGTPGTVELPDTGDIDADLRTVLRATVAEFADPAFEAPLRALYIEMITDADLAADYHRRMAAPINEAKRRRLRTAQEQGQLHPDADLDLIVEMLYAPLTQRWLLGTGPLDRDFADRLVTNALHAARAPGAGPRSA
ncbi:TetR/AcrR family transcriptional regulator [Micromonospora gifhornensis]|uniref:TetR/AcrR family transcriptional regulator n=1 Tax=Micromonospora gifhornensis TaxID=84594 RepID=UPI003D73DB60